MRFHGIKQADVMELADVTDSKSVGSNTVRVRPPPSAPKKAGLCLNRHSPAFFGAGGANSHSAGKARMHDSGRPKSLHDAATPTTVKARMPYKMNAQRL